MGQQINDNIRMDKDVKEQADKLFNELGLNMTTAINAFIKQALRESAIPFNIRADNTQRNRSDLGAAFREAQEQSLSNGTELTTMDEIDKIISEARKERREQL